MCRDMTDLNQPSEEEAPSEPMVSVRAAAVGMARARLKSPIYSVSVWKLFGAASFFAAAALMLAATVIVGPPQFVQQRVDVNPEIR